MLHTKTWIRSSLILFSLFLSVFLFTRLSNTLAQDISQYQKEILDRNSQIAKLEAEIDSYSHKVATTKAEADTLKQAISKLESQKKDLQNQISLTNLKIQNTEGDILQTVDKISNNQDTIAINREAMVRALQEMRKNSDNNLLINILNTKNGSLSDLLNETYKLTSLNNILTEKIAIINGTITELNTNREAYESQKNQLSDLSQDLLSRQGIIKQSQNEQNSLLKETKSEEAEYQKLIKDRKAKVEDLQNEINDFESKIQYTLNKDKLPSAGDGLFWPLKDPIITQHFGSTDFAKTGAYNGHGHNGIDMGTAVGTKVMAAESGVIMGIGDTDQACKRASYGKWVLIKHSNGLATLYGHLSSINVSEGENVTAGEQIGLSGNTGYSTGPHLHFTVIAADAVKIFGPTEYKSKVCGTYMVMPYAPLNAYLNPLDYLPKK